MSPAHAGALLVSAAGAGVNGLRYAAYYHTYDIAPADVDTLRLVNHLRAGYFVGIAVLECLLPVMLYIGILSSRLVLKARVAASPPTVINKRSKRPHVLCLASSNRLPIRQMEDGRFSVWQGEANMKLVLPTDSLLLLPSTRCRGW